MIKLRHLIKFRIQSIPVIVGLLLLLVLVRRSQQNWQTLAGFVEDRKYYDLVAAKNGVSFIDQPRVTRKDQVQAAVNKILEGAHRNTVFILGESRDAPEMVIQPIRKFSEEEVKKAEEVWGDGANYYKIYSKNGYVFGFKGKTYQAVATTITINGTNFDLLAFTCISRTIEKAYEQSLLELTVLLGMVAALVLLVLTTASRAVTHHSKTILSRKKSEIKAWWPEEIKIAASNYNQFLASEALYKVQIDQSTSGQMVVRSLGMQAALIHSANKAMAAISGYTPEELEGRPLNLIVPEEYHQYHLGIGVYDENLKRRVGMVAYAGGCPFHGHQKSRIVGSDRTVDLLHKDGSIRKVILGVYYVGRNDKAEDEWSGVVTDVTELVKTVESEKAIREKFELLQQSWRHDLLSAVLGTHNMFEVLTKIGFKVEDPTFKEPYDIARAKAKFAYKLVRDTRDLGVSLQNLHKEPVRLGDAMELIKILFPEANITYSVTDEDREILINESSFIGRAISNLINNAIKFSGTNGEIEVGIRTKDENAIFFVKDNGIGIDEEGQKKIFSGFGTGIRLVQEIDGTGLGLHSANEIVKAHGGSITVKSKLGQGSVFFVKLPLLT